ncbi:MAG: ammonium transporter [Thermodesulfobacteria bacterium]|nr:ammonium transporter [Thermodesulfobacteriota bacterium]
MIKGGDTAWILVSVALVMLMTLPGLAVFYGGLAKRKDVLNTIGMSLVTYILVSILWVIYGYSLCFSGDVSGVIGNFSKVFLSGVLPNTASGSIPEVVFAAYQLTFAAITVALISGSYIERMSIGAWLLFSLLWFTFVYAPIAHWVWGGGFLAKKGVLDFAGGIVVHLTAGIAGLVGALVLGKRKEPVLKPHNMTLVVIGTGLLWFGWFGFNGGSALAANGVAGTAVLNTNTAAAVAAFSWMLVEWLTTGKPTILGICSGAIGGLATITPAAGFVNLKGAFIIGILAGIIPYFVITVVKEKLGYDDALDVFNIHGVGGILGTILTGVFADPAINKAAGLLYGNPSQLGIQLFAVGVSIVYVAVVTLVIFGIVKVFTKLRVSEEEEYTGLDSSQHGENAYSLD